ncbi:MAG TPA: hypothetical protein VMY78_06345 [Solirubrobacteraceae bacterium]|nr:hypothetical protein [Solirubrobacteraceae bacterium]
MALAHGRRGFGAHRHTFPSPRDAEDVARGDPAGEANMPKPKRKKKKAKAAAKKAA